MRCALRAGGAALRGLGRLAEASKGSTLKGLAQAMADFNTAVHLEPFNVQVLMGRAHVLRDQGKASEAVACLICLP